MKSGESVGIVGGNGAGKSTLLRVAAGITRPTSPVWRSRAATWCRLLELGTGFEMEFSAARKSLLNGALLGRSRAEIRLQLNAIIEFSGLEQFIERRFARTRRA